MAVVGDAYVVVRALTNRVKPDIQRAFSGLDRIGETEGQKISRAFNKGLNSSRDDGIFTKKFRREAEATRQSFNRLIQTGYFLAPAISGVVGAIGSLGAGLVTLITALSRATPAAIALGGALAALAQGAGVLALGFSGVGAAISAGNKAVAGAAQSTRGLERAQKRISDLQDELKEKFDPKWIFEQYLEAAQQVRDAEDDLADATINLERTQRAYQRAQRAALDAQEDVTKAREEAKEAIQQLRFELEGGAISEKRARLEFEKARESLQRVQDLPPNSRARQEAELAFAEAELNLRKAIDRNSDLQKEEAAATRAGVEGSERVQDALRAQADAVQAVNDAEVDYAREKRDFAKLEEDVAKIRAENSEDAVLARIKEERAELRAQIDEAKKDLDDLKKSAAGPASAYQQALEKLSPAAQEFVKFIIANREEFQKLKFAAQEGLFPGLQKALETLINKLFPVLEPLLYGTGQALGAVAEELAGVITKTENLERLERVWKTGDKLIGNFGGALGSIYELLLILLDAGRPVIEEFGQWIEDLTGGWASDASSNFDTIRGRMQEAAEIVKRLAGIFGRLFDAFGSIGESIVSGGALDLLLTYFEEATDSFANLMESMNQDGSLGEYFLNATENATKVLDLLGNIVAEILKLGDDEGVGVFVDKLSQAVDVFGEIGTEVNNSLPAFGDFIIAFAEMIQLFTESGSLTTFFETLTTGIDILKAIFEIPGVKQAFLLAAPFFAAFRAVSLMGRAVSFVTKGMIGNFLAVGKGAKKGLDFLLKPDVRRKFFMRFDTLRLKAMYAMDSIKNGAKTAGGAAKTMGSKVGNALKTAGGGIKKGASKSFDALKTAFRGVGTAAATMGTAIKTAFTKIIGVVKTALMTIGRVLMANPWILIIVAIVAIVALIIMNWDKIKEIVGAALDWIGEKISMVWNWIKETTSNIWNGIVDFFTTFGGKILTAIGDLATTVLDFILEYHPIAVIWRLITENWETISSFFMELPGKIVEFVGGLATTVLDFINKYHPILILWRLIRDNWDTIKTWFKNLPGRIKDAIYSLATTVRDFINKYHPIIILWNKAKEIWPTVYGFFKEKITALLDFFKTLPQKFKNGVTGIWDFLKDGFIGILNKMIRAWNDFSLRLEVPSNAVTDFFRIGGKGFTINTPNIPPIQLAKGGIVAPSTGGTLAQIAEAGRPERVEPLDENGLSKRDKVLIDALTRNQRGGGDITVNVYPSADMNERELAQKVSRELVTMLRRGAA